MKNTLFLLQLLHTQGLGREKAWKLLCEYGSAQKALEARAAQVTPESWERDLEAVEQGKINLITYEDPNYPKNLLKIPNFPLLLYVKGTLPPETPSLAIIGTRNATLYGKQAAHQISRDVASRGACVVSGLARGIDTAAHEGALQGAGKTVAVIGSGLGRIYPHENLGLAEKIADSGAVVSEYPMLTPPAAGLFPRRNRIISGLSDAICLIESPLQGGGMLTMELGLQHQRPLFAIPGRIDWPTFVGNHFLIKESKARLVENGEDLLKHLNIVNNQIVKQASLPFLSSEEKSFLNTLPAEEKSIEELVLLTQLPIMQLNVLLTRLILKKVVKEFPGKIYKKVS